MPNRIAAMVGMYLRQRQASGDWTDSGQRDDEGSARWREVEEVALAVVVY